MSRSLVTIGHYWNSVDARLARIHLEAAGIDSVLQNENSVTTNWLEVANASRGVQLQVAEADVDAAMRVLQEKAPASDEIGNEWESEPAAPEGGGPAVSLGDHVDPGDEPDDDPGYAPLNRREQCIQRAYIAAMLGILFLPLEFFALYQMVPAAFMKEPLRASVQRKSRHAWIVIVLVTLAYGLLMAQAGGYLPPALPPTAPQTDASNH
jgi:hypothetical protein